MRIVCLLIAWINIEQSAGSICWKPRDAAHYEGCRGDIMLTAFFPVHRAADALNGQTQHHGGADCSGNGKIQDEAGVQPVEALLHILDEVHEQGMLPGFTLGAIIVDSCNDPSVALDKSMEIIQSRSKGFEVNYVCRDLEGPDLKQSGKDLRKVVGVIGGRSSSISLVMASALKLQHVPQVSYHSTTPDLSNSHAYPYFKRVVPSDVHQAEAIMWLLDEFSWRYVSVLYENSNYGVKGYAELVKRLNDTGYSICFAHSIMIELDDEGSRYDNIIGRLVEDKEATVIILWADTAVVRKVFEAAERHHRREINDEINNGVKLKSIEPLVWIGVDAWSGHNQVLEDIDLDIMQRIITVQPLIHDLPGFEDYFMSLTPDNVRNSEWFGEYWSNRFNCTLLTPMSQQTVYMHGESRKSLWTSDEKHVHFVPNKLCPPHLKITDFKQHNSLHYIRDAVMAYVNALKNLHAEVCGNNYQGLCDAFDPESGNTTERLLENLIEVNFTATSGYNFSFSPQGDGPSRYSFLHYNRTSYQDNTTQLSPWTRIGGSKDDVVGLAGYSITGRCRDLISSYPTSQCTKDCQPYEAREFIKKNRCCWKCVICDNNTQYVEPEGEHLPKGSDKCSECKQGQRTNRTDYRGCEDNTLTYVDLRDKFSIIAMTVVALGLIATTATTCVFIWARNTPIVKASGEELSLYILASIFISFLTTFFILIKPTEVTCGIIRVLLGMCFTPIYAAILTKTVRVYRLFSYSMTSRKRPRFTSARSQLMIVNSLVIVQFAITLGWMVISRPAAVTVYPSAVSAVLVCDCIQSEHILLTFLYPLVLMFLCVIFAVKTRKLPDGYKETQLIALTSYTTLVLWLAFLPIYVAIDEPFARTATMSSVITINAIVVLACLFGPKIYIILLRKEKNTREAMMGRTASIIESLSTIKARERGNTTGSADMPILQKLFEIAESKTRRCSLEELTKYRSHTLSTTLSTASSNPSTPQGSPLHPHTDKFLPPIQEDRKKCATCLADLDSCSDSPNSCILCKLSHPKEQNRPSTLSLSKCGSDAADSESPKSPSGSILKYAEASSPVEVKLSTGKNRKLSNTNRSVSFDVPESSDDDDDDEQDNSNIGISLQNLSGEELGCSDNAMYADTASYSGIPQDKLTDQSSI